MLLAQDEIDVGPLFIDALKENNMITESEFSFAMNGLDRDMSYMDIGAPDYSKVAGGEEAMVRIDMLDDFFWSNFW